MLTKKNWLTFAPLTPERWGDFETLFGERGACGGCWCMVWRCSRKEFEANKGAGNRAAMKGLVEAGAEPGVLAYADGAAIGWCAVARRQSYPFLERSRTLRPVDNDPVWSVSCLFVAKPFRRRGVTVALLKEAVRFVDERGGKVVEGYPIEPRSAHVPAVFAWTGLASAFLKAGFREHRRVGERPIMRAMVKRAVAKGKAK